MKDFFKIRTPLAEEGGAGEQGTPSLVAKYKNATPGQGGSAPSGQQPARKGDKLNAKDEPGGSVKESLDEVDEAALSANELARRKAKIAGNATPASKKFVANAIKNVKARNESVEESLEEGYTEQDAMYRKEAVKNAERVMKAVGSQYMSGCKYHARALQDMADEMENTIEYRKKDEANMKAMRAAQTKVGY